MHAFYVGSIAIVEVTTANNPVIDQPLILQCDVIIVGDNTNTVDIIWTNGDKQIRRVNNVTARIKMKSSSVYNDSFIIPSLDISDIGSVYECAVLINSSLPAAASSNITIPIPGTYIVTYIVSLSTVVLNSRD